MTITVMMVDDHRMFREALRTPLQEAGDLQLVGEFNAGGELLEALRSSQPEVVILDISLPDMSGVDVARKIHKDYPRVGIVALSGYSDQMYVDEMLKAGALAYVLKSSGADELIAAIRATHAGRGFLSADLTSRMILRHNNDSALSTPPVAVLSGRERQVLRLVASGKRSADIAQELSVAVATVEVHRRNLRRKLGLQTTAELTRYAIRDGVSVA